MAYSLLIQIRQNKSCLLSLCVIYEQEFQHITILGGGVASWQQIGKEPFEPNRNGQLFSFF